MIHFNELKANARSLYETFKKVLDFESAMNQAITTVCSPFDSEQVVLPGKAFSSMDEVKEYIRKELDEEVNVIVEDGIHYSLTDIEGHNDWYRHKKANDEIKFRFWNRYRTYLTHIKGWAESSVEKLDTISDEILEKIEDPTVLMRPFDRRGLVVGYVQSGKTANFMGIINKSVDCGYRVIIVLSGMHENLRQQTQERIDEEIIGRDTSKKAEIKQIGVTTLPGEKYIPIDCLTESNFDPSKKGDFNIRKSHGTPPTTERPIIFIVKKNKSILKNLIKYFSDWIDTFDENLTYKTESVKQFNNLPLLIIDDEADQASVDTRPPLNSEGDEMDPTAINYCIREILNLFRQKVYIGYTATPFANIFIQHDRSHSTLGLDLFPSAFIISLDAPSNYLGPKDIFGLKNDSSLGLPIYRQVNDAGQQLLHTGLDNFTFMPIRHRPDYVPTELPNTLKEALKAFIISTAIRWQRGQDNRHNTMLIHCTRYNTVQIALADLVNDEMKKLRNAILSNDPDVFNELKELFERDFIPTSLKMKSSLGEWSNVVPFIFKTVKKIEPDCLIVNGTVGDILDYKNKAKTGLSVIAIGGDKLSRGLTLEGLTISYFTRSTSLYDTLMQMGRWFGYRSGFEDLCRLYTTQDLFGWYRHIATAFESLREEFIEMARLKLSPKDFGLRVEDHPDMMVTSVMKMRATNTMRLNYQGTLTETSTLPSDDLILKSNYKAAEDFILSLGEPENSFYPKYVWLGVPVLQVRNFLKSYLTYKGLPTANTIRINQYIELQQNKENPEFTNWNVSLVTLDKKETNKTISFASRDIAMPSRKITDLRKDSFFIQRMHDPNFEFSDFTPSQMKIIQENKYSNKESRNYSPRKQRPLLMIYVLNLKDKETDADRNFIKQPVAFAISWPSSETAESISYVINSVYTELELSEYD